MQIAAPLRHITSFCVARWALAAVAATVALALMPAWLSVAGAVLLAAGVGCSKRRAGSALARDGDRLRLALEAGRMGWWEWDLSTDAVRWSENLEAMMGFPPGGFGGTLADFLAVVHPDDRDRVVRESVPSDGSGHSELRYRVIRPDGTVRWVEDFGDVVSDAAGNATVMVGVMRDVTDRVEAEEALHRSQAERARLELELRQAQKLEAIGRLAGGVAHDFNNMMSAVVGFSEIALDRLEPGHPVREQVEQIRYAGERATELTRHLLAFSRKQVLQPRVLDLNALVADVERLLTRLIGDDVELSSTLDETLAPVLADPGQIEQVLVNLAVNARDAMPNGGVLAIETAAVDVDPIAASRLALSPGRHAVVTVTDTGVGMDETTLAQIFEPFFTTKPEGEGTGLGLSTAYGIVKQSGGAISVESEPGRGTSFSVYLPVVSCEPEAACRGVDARAAERGRGETVLLVEDEEVVRRLGQQMLEQLGYEVLVAGTPGEALRIGESHDGEIHLLLTDVVMRGMNGCEVARLVAASRPSIRVLFASGYADETISRCGILDENVAFLAKPFTPAALARAVRSLLDDGARAGR